MAIYKIFPTQDATLYSLYPETNTGLDEIIETSLQSGDTLSSSQSSRFLIQFDSNEITDVIDNIISGSQWQSNLKCFVANVTSLNYDTTIEIYPISQSWNMGTGRLGYSPEVTNGTSWIWRNYKDGVKWTTSSYAIDSTGSYSSSADAGGGTWYTNLSSSQTFGYYTDKDININTTEIVTQWYSSSLNNDGFILKQKDEFIDNEDVQPKMKYFSIDTHTIYPPYLEFKWIDSTFNTGSSILPTIENTQFVVSIGENPGYFNIESINKFRVYARPEYPTRVFSTSSVYTQNYYLPDNSYYAIKDLDTNEYVVDFDDMYTQLSKDEISSFFTLYMKGLQPERYYKILIKTIINGSVVVLDNYYYFKIING
jgi:hypothetical protein